MNLIIHIFTVVSTLFALATLSYVVIDLIIESHGKTGLATAGALATKLESAPNPEPEIIESAPVIIPQSMPTPISAESGIEVIDVAWPESMEKNKIYKYDPNGETVTRGDTVLVPTFDGPSNREVLRTATVINGNYRIESLQSGKVLKKLVRVVKRA